MSRIETLGQDLRYAARSLSRAPGFSVTTVLTLALGIGASTGVFSMVSAVLLAPLPYPEPDRLVHLVHTTGGGSFAAVTAPEFLAWRDTTPGVQDAAAYRYPGGMNLTGGNGAEQVTGGRVSARFFALLGAPFAEGLAFTDEDDRPGAPPVAIVSERFRMQHLGGTTPVVGTTISLDGRAHTIVGVLAAGFDPRSANPYVAAAPDVWVPLQLDPASTSDAHNMVASGRLRADVTLAEAEAQTRLAESAFRRAFPGVMPATMGLSVTPLAPLLSRDVRASLALLLAAVVFLLVIASGNVAGLQLVRASTRARELAIRAAAGASGGRLMQLLLTESILLALPGGALGVALGVLGMRALLSIQPGDIPRIAPDGSDVALDWRVVVFALLVTTASALVTGVSGAWSTARSDLARRLTVRRDDGGGSGRTRAAIVAGELAMATVLLVGSVLLIRSFVALRDLDPGFDGTGVLTMRVAATDGRFAATSRTTALADEGVRTLGALPGVSAVAATLTDVPLDGDTANLKIEVAGRVPEASLVGSWRIVSPDYFAVFRIPLTAGRLFGDRDRAGSEPIVVINQSLARRFWPDGTALDGRILLGRGAGPEFEDVPRRIVGIVGDTRQAGLNRDPRPAAYVPLAQLPDAGMEFFNRVSGRLTWVVRADSRADAAFVEAARDRLRDTTGIPVSAVRSMSDVARASTARTRFEMWLLAIFGAAAAFLAGLGVYGVASVAVQQRTREIGIRLALGATAATVRRSVLGRGMVLAVIGIAIGLSAALALSRWLSSFVFGISTHDRIAFAVVPAILAALSLVATWLPARRAMRVDPAITLQAE